MSLKQYRYVKLAEELTGHIDNHRWVAGERLPSIRSLSSVHGVSINTVIQTLHELENQGLIESRPKSGFFVTLRAKPKSPAHPMIDKLEAMPANVPEIFQDIMTRSAAFDIAPEGLQHPPTQSLIILHRRINNAMRSQINNKAFYYDEPKGTSALRCQISDLYRSVGVDLTADDYCITSGCQNSLFLALMTICQPGDNVVVESPGFYGVLQLCQQLGLNVIEVPSSVKTGLNVDFLESALKNWKIKACIVTPAFATPTGASMPSENREHIIRLANQYDTAIIEDDIYGDLGFTSRPEPLKVLDREDRVVLCSSFSKSLSRDLRLGWIAGGRWHDRIVKRKLVTSLAGNQALQTGLANFISKGDLKRHLQQKRQGLKRQRDQLVHALHKHFPANIRFSIPNGGLSLWIELEKRLDSVELYQQLLKKKVVITPGALFSLTSNFDNFLRLSFSHPLTEARETAIKVLAARISD